MKRNMRILLTFSMVLLLPFGGLGCTSKAKKAYHQARADRYYNAGEMGQAEVEYLNVLRYDPQNGQAYGRLGLIYYDQGRLSRSAFFLGKGSQLRPDDLDLRIKLGYIESSVGQFTQALAQANFVLDKKPQDDEAPLLLAEASVLPKDVQAARGRLQSLMRNGDRASLEVALGNLALHEHDMAAATAAFKKGQALDPKSPAVNTALGMAAWAQGDIKQAGSFFKAAAEASPIRSPRRMQYARFKAQAGDLAGARAALEEILKSAPDYVPASMVLAEIAATQKKFDDCAGLLDKILAQDQDNFDALFFKGQLDLARNQPAQAVTDMERMAHLYPQVPPVQYQLGSAYLAANDSTHAAASFARALELNPDFIDATLTLAELQIRNGNADPAITALERLRRKQPKLVQAQLLLADAYRMRNRTADSLAIYQNLETMYPTNQQVALLHGAALLQLQDNVGARKAFERVLELSPGNLPAIEQLVDLDLLEKQYEAATQLINRQIQTYPQQIPLRLLAAKILLAEAKHEGDEAATAREPAAKIPPAVQRMRDQAEAVLVQALQIDPSNQATLLYLAQLYSDTGQNEKALAKLNEAMAKNPDNPTAIMLAATIYSANKNYQGAADAYERVLKLDPKYSPALNNLAYLYSEYLNNLDRAYELAQRARSLLPFEPSTADTLGWICFKRGSYEAALGFLKEAAAKLKDPEVQYHLGMASYMTADESTARAALQRALQPGTDFHGRAEGQLCLSILDVNPATADAAARTLLEKRVAERADDPVAQVRLARIYQRDGNSVKATAAYEAVLQSVPKNLDAMLNLTQLYAAKNLKQAYEMAKAASKLAPFDPQVSHVLGRLAFQSGDYNLATSMLQQAKQSQPDDPALLYDYALAAYSIGKVPEAQATLQSALALNLPAAQAGPARRMLDLIALAAAPAQAAAASARINEILKSEPDDVPALMARVAASEANSDTATAEQTCEKVLAHYPDFVPAQAQLARLYAVEPGKLDRANDLALKVHDALPDDPQATKTLGIILVQRADYSHAVSLLKQSAYKLNSDPEVFYYLGSAQFHLKNRPESKANLQQALTLKLSGPLADSAKRMLGELK